MVAAHPDGPAAGERLAAEAAARLAHAIEGLRDFPRIGQAGAVPGVREILVPGPTRRLTFTIGYRLEEARITILGITWGGRSFAGLGRR